jgi:hypothetical protein
MRVLLMMLLCSSALIAASEAQKPGRIREVSLRKLPLRDGERIAAIQIDVTGATFRKASIPYDWGFDITPPVAGASTLKGTAQHSSAFVSAEELQKFVALAFYPSLETPFTIKASVVLYSYDQKTKQEAQRSLDVPRECIIVE